MVSLLVACLVAQEGVLMIDRREQIEKALAEE